MLNKRSFLYQAGLLASSNTLLLLLNFIYRILLGRMAGPEGLGVYTLAMQVYSIVMSVCVSGLCVAVTNLAARMGQAQNYNGLRKMCGFAVACFLVLLAMSTAPILFFKEVVAEKFLGDIRTVKSLSVILACIALTGVENILKALFNGMRLVKFSAISEVGEQTLRIIIAVTLLARYINGDHGHTSFLILLGMTASEVYSVLFLGISFFRKIRPKGMKKGGESFCANFLKIALPSAGTAILANVFASAATVIFPQRLLLAGYTHAQAVSSLGLISGMIMPVLLLPSALISALCTLLMPNISASLARRDTADLQRKTDKGIEVLGLLGLPATGMLLPFVPLLCTLLFAQTAPASLTIVMSVEVVVTYYLLLSTSILHGLGKQKQILAFAAGSEVLQLGLVWVLSAEPSLHVYGYLIGMLLGDLLRTGLSFAFVHKATGTRPKLFHAGLVPIACAVILYCCARMLFFAFVTMGLPVLPAILSSFLICIILYVFLLRMLGVKVFDYMKRVIFLRNNV